MCMIDRFMIGKIIQDSSGAEEDLIFLLLKIIEEIRVSKTYVQDELDRFQTTGNTHIIID